MVKMTRTQLNEKTRTQQLNDGKRIPALAWGNGSSGLTASGEMAATLGANALLAGISHIDTAQVGAVENRLW